MAADYNTPARIHDSGPSRRQAVRQILTVLACLVLASSLLAAEKLTPKEIADGWIMLFDGETTFGWKIEGDAKVEKGVLIVGGTKDTTITTTSRFGFANLMFDANNEAAKEATFTFNAYVGPFRQAAHPRFSGWITYGAQVDDQPFPDLSIWGTGSKGFGRRNVASTTTIAFHSPAGQTLELRNIRLRPRRVVPLFNGKDLDGWKQFTANPKQAKSKFSVTPEGWLNVKNGPGDLQTEAQFDDFILQLECISNGKQLNSGIFFRCLPGEYQQGYEAQIQNGYKGDDRTKPVDYGTGAIYRRQPARRVVSNDNEWFTMTVLAHGKHLATWVNGYQVTDFTDERPQNDNARNGSKTGKGPISIQGHDPTTDLSFRNIRIAGLKKD
jgi:hypothetical protein